MSAKPSAKPMKRHLTTYGGWGYNFRSGLWLSAAALVVLVALSVLALGLK